MVVVGVARLAQGPSWAAEPEIHVVTDKTGKTIALAARGLNDLESARAKSEDYAHRVFVIRVHEEGADELPPMLGSYQVDKDVLQFTPRFPFRPETAYRATLRLPDREPIVKDFVMADLKPAERTRVATVYPTASVLPENLLKFYLHFTGPMGRGEAYEHLKLVKVATGKVVDAPFLEIGEELWNASGTRLTLFIDPGRIKKGVKPREDLGPALQAEEEYRLLIDESWRDAAGKPLVAGFEKRFKAGPPVETEINIKEWKIQAPQAGGRGVVSVRFTRPLDHALLERTFHVNGPDGKPKAGQIAITDEERRWEFRPDAAWTPGVHRILVNTVLEDLAGNRIGKAFEVDELRPLDKVVDVESVELPFLVK
jgi:hypothetical protein